MKRFCILICFSILLILTLNKFLNADDIWDIVFKSVTDENVWVQVCYAPADKEDCKSGSFTNFQLKKNGDSATVKTNESDRVCYQIHYSDQSTSDWINASPGSTIEIDSKK